MFSARLRGPLVDLVLQKQGVEPVLKLGHRIKHCHDQGAEKARSWSKANLSWILAISGSSAMGLVSEGEEGVMDLRSARMWLFFQ